MSAPDDNIRKYRASTLGTTLAEALQSLVEEEKITKREAASIFGKFDDVSRSPYALPVLLSLPLSLSSLSLSLSHTHTHTTAPSCIYSKQ